MIDHLTARDIAELQIPLLGDEQQRGIAKLMGQAIDLQAQARHGLSDALGRFAACYPPPVPGQQRSRGWSVGVQEINDRIDVAVYDPLVTACRAQMTAAGGVPCAELATPTLPPRYKRYYVEADYGRPVLSGRQLLQARPVNLRYVSDRSFKDPAEYEVRQGMVIFGQAGRSEQGAGRPALIISDRDGWLASDDIIRLRPHPEVDPGWLYLAVASFQAQTQIKALAFGSVIDHMRPKDIAHVVLPPPDTSLATLARESWESFADAGRFHQQAVDQFQACLDQAVSAAQPGVLARSRP